MKMYTAAGIIIWSFELFHWVADCNCSYKYSPFDIICSQGDDGYLASQNM